MFGVNWGDPQTWWLNVTNLGLGIVVLVCFGAVVIGIVQELHAKRKLHTEMKSIDREVAGLVADYQDGHAFHVPGLGLTMADGGEPDAKDRNQR